MQRVQFLLILLFITITSFGQNISSRLAARTQDLLEDYQMKNASMSFYVADAATGDMVYNYDGDRGLSPASSQKIFTAIAAFDILGSDYRYKTELGYNGTLSDGVLKGNLIVSGYGDPTLGTWRFVGYKPEDVKNKILASLANVGIRAIDGNIIIDGSNWSFNPTPGGWPWNDIGNYYGAGDWGVNWQENQTNVTFRGSSNIGGHVSILKVDPELEGATLVNKLTTASASSGDNSTIYVAPYSTVFLMQGAVPSGKRIMVTGTMPNPPLQFGAMVKKWLAEKNIYCTGEIKTSADFVLNGNDVPSTTKRIDQYFSPELHDIVHYFLRKSVNLYGESFAKAIGYQKDKDASTENGVGLIRKFWQDKGISNAMLKMIDGSGLSPQNYVCAKAEVKALLYAQDKDWFKYFYEALPTYNGMKMKSGTIGGCKAYAGYEVSKVTGKKYVFSIIINNYYGSQYSLLPKMYKVLDVLK